MLAPWEAKYRLVWFYPVVRRGTLVRDFPVVARLQQTSDPLILAFPWSFGSIHHTLLFRCKTHTGEKDVVYWLLTLSLPCIIAGGKLARSMLVCFQVTYLRLLGNPLAWHLVYCPMIQFQDVILALTYAKATPQRNVSPKASSRFFPAIVLGPACCRQVSMTSCLSILCRFSLLCLNSRWWTCKLIGACQDRGLSQPMPLPWATLITRATSPRQLHCGSMCIAVWSQHERIEWRSGRRHQSMFSLQAVWREIG